MSADGSEPIAVTANGGTVPCMISFLRGTPMDDYATLRSRRTPMIVLEPVAD